MVKNYLKYLAVIMAVALISCSIDVPPEKMEIKLLFTIDGSFEPKTIEEYDKKFTILSDIEVDGAGNIYLFNPRMERIIKFDRDGKFIKYFGSRGAGRGEMQNALDFTILQDTIYVKNNFTPLIIRYSLDGEYIDDYWYTDGKMQLGEIIRAVSDDRIVGYLNSAKIENGIITYNNKLVILNRKYEEIAILREYSAKLDKNDPQFFEFMTKYAYGGSKIYVAENEDRNYRISVYDVGGKKINGMQKDFKEVRYNEYELEKIKKIPLSMSKTKDERDTLQVKPKNKRSINDVFYDKYGRLLVCPSVKRNDKNQNDFIADIFENDKFVKRVVIPQLKGEDFLYRLDSQVYFIGDRIYEVLNKEMKVNVYEY